ncbi:hypothetical protein V1514DRAFT_289325 [Lipomyces japonicus]|uniref:uncharacterized protein n=1 Tax=Lipomyces japonicus TaxID=56871 RepID=UPI0034CD6517
MSEPINANPKVLSLEDLPTRSLQVEVKQNFPRSALDEVIPLNTPAATITTQHGALPSWSSLLLLDDDDEDAVEEQVPGLTTDESDSNSSSDDDDDENVITTELIDEQEIYDLISTISDPEHPLTLGQLAVVNKPDITIVPSSSSSSAKHATAVTRVVIAITPTITHCSLATLIGLGIRVRLQRCLPARFRIEIKVKEGTHQSESQVNKQLNDKERVAAACENQQLLGVLSGMLATCK